MPPEILARCFLALVRKYVDGAPHLNQPPWGTITKVCRHWRELSLNTPRLWSYILLPDRNDGENHRIQLFLGRSRQAPLTVLVMEPETIVRHSDTTLQLILNNLSRIKHLSIPFSINLLQLADATGLDAPVLESAVLDVIGSGQMSEPHLQLIQTADWSHLRALACHYATWSICKEMIRPHLTSLHIFTLADPQPSIDAWIELLSGLPDLEHLSLTISMDPVSIEGITPVKKMAHLPHLRSISFHEFGEGVASANLMRHLEFPSDATFEGGATRRCTDREAHFVLSVFAEKVAGSGLIGTPAPIRILVIEEKVSHRESCLCFKIYFSTEEVSSSDNEILATYPGSQSWCIRIGCSKELAVRTFLTLFPLGDVDVVRFSMLNIQDEETWEVLSQLPKLRNLHISHSTTTVKSFLSSFPNSSTVPRLHMLCIDGVPSWSDPSETGTTGQTPSFIAFLMNVLRLRKEIGLGLAILKLMNYQHMDERDRYSRTDVDLLKEVVDYLVEVDVGGSKTGCSVYSESGGG